MPPLSLLVSIPGIIAERANEICEHSTERPTISLFALIHQRQKSFKCEQNLHALSTGEVFAWNRSDFLDALVGFLFASIFMKRRTFREIEKVKVGERSIAHFTVFSKRNTKEHVVAARWRASPLASAEISSNYLCALNFDVERKTSLRTEPDRHAQPLQLQGKLCASLRSPSPIAHLSTFSREKSLATIQKWK